jgi:O-antigen ligase
MIPLPEARSLSVRQPGLRPLAMAIFGLAAAFAANWLLASRPKMIDLVAVLLLARPLLVSPRVRVIFLMVGTLVAFGPASLNTPKLLFLFGAAVALGGALSRSRELVDTPAYEALRPLLHAAFVLLVVVLISLPVALVHGVAKKDWLRDVAHYVLLSWAPLFAVDAQSAFSVRALRRLMALFGLGAAGVFAIHLLHRHGFATLYGGDVGLATLLLGAALFSFAIAMALDGERGRLRWLGLAALVFAMLASTGTRTVATLLAAPLAVVVGSRRGITRRSVRLAVAVPIAALLAAIGTQSLLHLVHANSQAVSQRIQLFFQSGSRSDQSYSYRIREVHSAWALFKTEPVFGVGPGHVIPWRDDDGTLRQDTYIDSPVGFLPDYGIVGLAAVAYLVASFFSIVRRLRRRTGTRTTSQLALVGFGAVVLAYSVLQVPFEDKGLPVGLMLLLAIAAGEAAASVRRSAPAE